MTVQFQGTPSGFDVSHRLTATRFLTFRNCIDGEVLLNNQVSDAPTGGPPLSSFTPSLPPLNPLTYPSHPSSTLALNRNHPFIKNNKTASAPQRPVRA